MESAASDVDYAPKCIPGPIELADRNFPLEPPLGWIFCFISLVCFCVSSII
jgi:hypothetical protein